LTIIAICEALEPSDLLRFEPEQAGRERPSAGEQTERKPMNADWARPAATQTERTIRQDLGRSNRSRFMTLPHAATKSRTNFSLASSDA
jgi:hypothetical protein